MLTTSIPVNVLWADSNSLKPASIAILRFMFLWSSSEVNLTDAWVVNFVNLADTLQGSFELSRGKMNGYLVRPIRAFGNILGCTDASAFNYNSEANIDNGSCVSIITGCLDSVACNYDSTADVNTECVFAQIYYDCYGDCLNDLDLDDVCDEEDNCIDISNTDQLDDDEDGEGDACNYDDGLGFVEVMSSGINLIKIIDVLGREYKSQQSGMLLFYIYDDGTVQKKYISR